LIKAKPELLGPSNVVLLACKRESGEIVEASEVSPGETFAAKNLSVIWMASEHEIHLSLKSFFL
jgi:hypothetical protein